MDHTERVRNLFERKATGWQEKYKPGGPLTGRIVRFKDSLRRHTHVGVRVLDFGCGTGELARALSLEGYDLTGIDISEEMLSIAQAGDYGGAIEWKHLHENWQRLPFEDDTFDAIVASSVLEYVGDTVAVMLELQRVLVHGGVLLCTVPNIRHPRRRFEQALTPFAGFASRSPIARAERLRNFAEYLQLSHRHSEGTWRRMTQQAHFDSLLVEGNQRTALILIVMRKR